MDRDFDPEKGKYLKIMNELAEKLITYELTKIEHRVLWMFFRFCYGFRKSTCELRWSDMLDITGLPQSSLAKALKGLKNRNILHTTQTESRSYVTYKINSKLSSWKPSLHKCEHSTNVEQSLHKRGIFTPQIETTPYKEIKTKNKGGVDKKKKIPPKVELPTWLDVGIWGEFKKYRQKSGKGKFTDYAQRLAIGKLTQLKAAGNDPSEVMKQSILHGWSGLFEIKKEIREESKVKEITNRKLQEALRIESL